MPSQEDLESVIRSVFNVTHLEIEDVSSGCGQSYSIVLVSPDFEGLTTLKRHRLVNEKLKVYIADMHAFSQKTFTPTQYEASLTKG